MTEKIWQYRKLAATAAAVTAVATNPTVWADNREPLEPLAEQQAWEPLERIFQLTRDRKVENWPSEKYSGKLELATAEVQPLIKIPDDSPIKPLSLLEPGWAGDPRSHAPSHGLQLRAQELLNECKRKFGDITSIDVLAGPQDYISFQWSHASRNQSLKLGIFDEGHGHYSCDWLATSGATATSDEADFSVDFLLAAVNQFLQT